jgi:hypothetical protein
VERKNDPSPWLSFEEGATYNAVINSSPTIKTSLWLLIVA